MVPCECYVPVSAHEIVLFVGNVYRCIVVSLYRSHVNQSRPNNLLKGFLNHYISNRMNNRTKNGLFVFAFLFGFDWFFFSIRFWLHLVVRVLKYEPNRSHHNWFLDQIWLTIHISMTLHKYRKREKWAQFEINRILPTIIIQFGSFSWEMSFMFILPTQRME